MRTMILVVLSAALLAGCANDPRPVTESNLTPGMAKATIVVGETSQAEVMEVFGPPDQVTHRDSMQIWTYDKIRYDMQASQGFLRIFGVGSGNSYLLGGGAGVANQRYSSSSTSTMLIMYFDADDIVRDYRMNTFRF